MNRLVILSDLWGNLNKDWVQHYTALLNDYYELVYYDCRQLGEIDLKVQAEDKIHQQFVNGGVDRAIKNLLQNEANSICVLGFSIGGYIAWKSALDGLKAKKIFAISSTRLRYESVKPHGDIELYFGEKDEFRPKSDWFAKLNLEEKIIKSEAHDFYRKRESAVYICNDIIQKREQ